MLRRLALLAASLAGTALALSPASAASTVSVSFTKSVGAAGVAAQPCAVKVAPGANGIAVLDAAVTKGCIDSYKVERYSFGAFISCIDDVCGAPAEALGLTYWAMSENGKTTDYGVEDFRAAAGDTLDFAYTTWLTFLLPV